MANIEDSICEAIDIIIEKAIAEASYDKTVQATIVSCVDETIGKYKVSYQDSTFYAYAGSSDISYPSGTSVYVLIPGNDMSKDKTILGTTKKLGINYVVTTEGDEAYEYTGTNIIDSSTEIFGLCSYREGTQAKVLYSKDYNDSQNLISIDETAMKEYIGSSDSIICGAEVRTALPNEQQYRGNYGIIFALDFLDNTNNEEVTRYYTVDVDKMVGNPYKLIYSTRQYGIFDIDCENFLQVNYISLFCYDFPNTLPEEQCVDDIFISNIELTGANRLSDDDISNYSLTFVTSKGTYFTSSNLDSDTITLEAQVRVKGKVIDNDSQELDYYWGTENVGVTAQNRYYNKYLGQGWKCLNDSNLIQGDNESDEAVVEWVPGSYIWTVQKSDIIAEEVTYKCAVIYDGTVITKTIVVKNLGSSYSISIESDSGTQFYYDIGYPTLTCLVNGKSQVDGYTYSWAATDNSGSFSTLAETADLNNDYNSILEHYNNLLKQIEDGELFPNAAADQLEEDEAKLKAYKTITRVEDNVIYHLNVNTITNFSTYQCTVYYEGMYLGTSSIVLTNTYDTEGTYSLIINDGSYVYKYNESGISPASGAVDNPIDIKALTFTIYDNLGQKIDDDVARHCDIQWIVPTANTLIQIPSSYTADSVDVVNNTATYKNMMSFSYLIADSYDVSKNNNDIYLIVNYKDESLSARTDLTFLKEGESGTNGTEYTCKIVPNPKTSSDKPKYLIFSKAYGANQWTANYDPASNNVYLKVQLWHNENCIYDGVTGGNTTDGTNISVTWGISTNKYSSNASDSSMLTVNAATGAITCSDYGNKNGDPANIVKVTVSDASNNITYHATFPVITVEYANHSGYDVTLKEGSGFQYAIYTSDGRTPKYDNANPFEITVNELIEGYWEDVSTSTLSSHKMSYTWSYLGTVYGTKDSTGWTKKISLEDRKVTNVTTKSNQKYVKPADDYDGECLSNAVQCVVKDSDNTTIATIHIPVHLMLNRYGLAFLNDWDGNSVEVNSDGGFVLAPQVGAGEKESDNSFSGIVMGKVKESNASSADTGLFGYYGGKRTIFLDSETGKSVFGAAGDNQIVIDPSTDAAVIRSGDYSTSAKKGLKINFSSTLDDEDNELGPFIKYGSGNFSVNSEGHIVAKGGGEIAGFNIDDHNLWTTIGTNSSKTNNSNFRISSYNNPDDENDSDNFSRTINGQSVKRLALASDSNFGVDMDGTMYAAKGIIGMGGTSDKITIGNDGNETSNNSSSRHSAIHSGTKTSLSASGSGFYLGTDGIALGNNFSVDSSGSLTAKDGTIGSNSNYAWHIGDRSIYLNQTGYASGGTSGVYIGTDGIGLGLGNFYVTSAGYVYAISGQIGGWNLSNYRLTSQATDDSGTAAIRLNGRDGIIRGGTSFAWSILADGTATFRYLNATSGGQIGGWTINGSTLESSNGNLTINGSGGGTLKGSSWEITGGGTATFNDIYITSGKINDTTMSNNTIGGGSITCGGTSMSSSNTTGTNGTTSLKSSTTNVDGSNIETYVKNLVCDRLGVTNSFTYNTYDVKWEGVYTVSSGLKVSTTTDTVDGHTVLKSAVLSGYLYHHYLLGTDSTMDITLGV